MFIKPVNSGELLYSNMAPLQSPVLLFLFIVDISIVFMCLSEQLIQIYVPSYELYWQYVCMCLCPFIKIQSSILQTPADKRLSEVFCEHHAISVLHILAHFNFLNSIDNTNMAAGRTCGE
jgi:hypothetical protein